MELAARIDALAIELEQRHEELKRHITHTVEQAIVPLLQHVEANSAHGSRCSSRTVSRAASCADVLRSKSFKAARKALEADRDKVIGKHLSEKVYTAEHFAILRLVGNISRSRRAAAASCL